MMVTTSGTGVSQQSFASRHLDRRSITLSGVGFARDQKVAEMAT